MKYILSALIKYKHITVFFILALAAAGILAFISLPKQETPEFSIPYALVTTVYPGASQADMDTLVTEPIERVIMETEGYESSVCYSSNSLSLIIVELEYKADRDESFSMMENRLRELQSSLPDGCYDIEINRNITDTAGVILSLSSPDAGRDELGYNADMIADELSQIEGFSRFEIIGEKQAQISVNVDLQKMMAAGLSLGEISNLVQAGNLDIPVGKLQFGDDRMAIDYTGSYESIEDIMNLEIGYSPELGMILKLRDIAKVTETEEPSSTRYYHDGEDAILIAGYFDEDINTLPLGKEINERLDDIRNFLPSGMNISLVISQPDEIGDSLGSFSVNLLIAIGLVILVVLIGMGFRNAIIVSISIPFSILMTFLVMYISDIRIHQISIAALIMSLGMLVDNSIVVSDSIQGDLDGGRKRLKACVHGTRNVAVPVFASTITTIAAFMPFLFLDSLAGDYIKSLPKIISISLSASYITAVLIIPVLGFIVFKRRKKGAGGSKRRFFTGFLTRSMSRRLPITLVVLVLLAGTIYLAMDIDKEFFPASDKDIVYIDIRNNKSDDIENTADIVGQISEMLETENEVLEYIASAGGGLPRFNQIMYVYTKTPEIGQIMIRTNLDESEFKTNGEFKEYLQQKLDDTGYDARIIVKQLMYAFPMDEDIRIRVNSDNVSEVKTAESMVMHILKNMEGVQNINKGNTDYIDIMEFNVNGESAAMNAVLPAEVLNEVSIAVSRREAAVLFENDRDIPVYVTGGISSDDGFEALMIKTGTGGYVSSMELLETTRATVLETIPRYNGEYSMLITADYESGADKAAVLADIKDSIEEKNMGGITILYEGEDELIRENFGQVLVMGAIALAVVFMILMVQFKSFSLPLLIFMTIPLSAIGSIAGLYISGLPISFTALLGIVSLLGIVVNNAIILIDYIRKEMENGTKIQKACTNAANRRLRPILLSTITTVIGLIPLVIGTSQLFKPMAVALMSGLMVSTLLTLVVIPVFAELLLRKVKAGRA